VRYRQIPCTHWKALFFESQLIVLVASLLFILVAWPRAGALSCRGIVESATGMMLTRGPSQKEENQDSDHNFLAIPESQL
jgi:hypothetical protein